MHIINLRMRELRKLKELYIEPGVLNTEALLLVLKKKTFPDNIVRVFKFLDLQIRYADLQEDVNVFTKKLFTVSSLNKDDAYLGIEELIIPDTIVYVDGELSGFAMPLIPKHRNLGAIINNDDISLEEKIPYLKQMGGIIEKVEKTTGKYPFYFGDLNEFNFIIDKNDIVKAIDLDSAYLGVGEPLSMAYYLLKNQYIKSLPEKYKTTDKGIIIPTNNTDLYCFNMIILNALAKENIYKYDIDTYYKYLTYIKELGIPIELVDALDNIYIPKDNTNPRDILDSIDTSLEENLSFKVFKKKYKNL